MKYTFNISKNITNNTTKSNNTKSNNNTDEILASLLDLDLSTRINHMNNMIFEKKSPEIITYECKKPKKIIDINIDITKNTSKNKPTFSEFCKAFSYLMSSGSYDTYDFKLDDGTPIKLFADEIQIGYELIPLNSGSKRIYDMLSDSKKKEIIDIYIDITK